MPLEPGKGLVHYRTERPPGRGRPLAALPVADLTLPLQLAPGISSAERVLRKYGPVRSPAQEPAIAGPVPRVVFVLSIQGTGEILGRRP